MCLAVKVVQLLILMNRTKLRIAAGKKPNGCSLKVHGVEEKRGSAIPYRFLYIIVLYVDSTELYVN